MKLSLINVFRNASFKKLDWLPDLFFGIGFFVTVLAMFWFRPSLNWFVVLMLPILVGLITEGLFMVIHGIYICLKNRNHEMTYHKLDTANDTIYNNPSSKHDYGKYNKF